LEKNGILKDRGGRREEINRGAPSARQSGFSFMRSPTISATSWDAWPLREKLIKIGAKVVSHGRYVVF